MHLFIYRKDTTATNLKANVISRHVAGDTEENHERRGLSGEMNIEQVRNFTI
jgi:hypothetical protein